MRGRGLPEKNPPRPLKSKEAKRLMLLVLRCCGAFPAHSRVHCMLWVKGNTLPF